MNTGQSGGPRIAILGAGSISLGPLIINDLLSRAELDGAVLTLMALHEERLGVVERWAVRAVRQNGLQTVIRATTSRREALSNADYVFALFDGGGFSAFDSDYRIATSYGLDICIGDTMGPTGIMKGLRNIAAFEEVAADYRELCPQAPLLTYVNPMAAVVMAAEALGIRTCVGLCGGIEATRELIAECLELAPQQLETQFAESSSCAGRTAASPAVSVPSHRALSGRPKAIRVPARRRSSFRGYRQLALNARHGPIVIKRQTCVKLSIVPPRRRIAFACRGLRPHRLARQEKCQ